MRRMNVYDLYMDDGEATYKVTVPAFSKKDAKAYVEGNGEVEENKQSELQDIDLNCLADTLKRSGWGQQEVDVITRALAQIGLER